MCSILRLVSYGLRRFDLPTSCQQCKASSGHWVVNVRVAIEKLEFELELGTEFYPAMPPDYLKPFTRLSDVPSRSSRRSTSSLHLLIPSVRRSTVVARAFPVYGPALWNSLPSDITSIDSLPVFRRRLENSLFLHSYPGAVQFTVFLFLWPRSFLYCTWSQKASNFIQRWNIIQHNLLRS